MQEWLNWHAWKACIPLKGIRGSNPLLSAKNQAFTECKMDRKGFFFGTLFGLIPQLRRNAPLNHDFRFLPVHRDAHIDGRLSIFQQFLLLDVEQNAERHTSFFFSHVLNFFNETNLDWFAPGLATQNIVKQRKRI